VALKRLLAILLAGFGDHGNCLWLILDAEARYRMRILGDALESFGDSLEAAPLNA